jgi:hypothetical protein
MQTWSPLVHFRNTVQVADVRSVIATPVRLKAQSGRGFLTAAPFRLKIIRLCPQGQRPPLGFFGHEDNHLANRVIRSLRA